MGEAMLFAGEALHDGSVRVGPLRLRPRHAVAAGAVKAAIRPEAWRVGAHGEDGLPGTVAKHAYLGSFQELSIETGLGSIFVVSAETSRSWSTGDAVTLQLDGRGVSIVSG